jgi:hypothetical protein
MNNIAEYVRNRGVKFTSSDSETELYMSKYKKLDHTSNGNVARSTLEIPSLNEVEERKNAALNGENESNLAAMGATNQSKNLTFSQNTALTFSMCLNKRPLMIGNKAHLSFLDQNLFS